ncbi:YihY/virulence factor BrkB family protein [Roseovarius aestuariivivens]|uniref:YihY/virulence factor BrkB family protein n=1 Tax=Roseovarius aestuariivivens TaxID=1888910 RepID=UPI00107FD9C5|nr:YihY/virulence factor BrkB family protein [Roseovarius aestuariivivens]
MSRGRAAQSPGQIPLVGLLDVGFRLVRHIMRLNVGLLAAGIAFYGLLSIFPGITAAVALAGLMMPDDMLLSASELLASFMPDAARDIVMGQLDDVVSSDQNTLSVAALAALALALYSASRAVGNFIAGLNIIYGEVETRGFFKLRALTLFLTLALIVGVLFCILVVAAIPALAALFGARGWLLDGLLIIRWPLMFAMGAFGIGMLYRYAPNRRPAKWRWLTPGAVLACLLWVAGSVGFSLYVQRFGSYNETFGALGGVIILLTWMWLSAFIILLGAQLDAELEAQTEIDSTIGADRPMGERGASKADNLGPTMDEILTGGLKEDHASDLSLQDDLQENENAPHRQSESSS